jgi:T5orf172 domain
MTPSGNPTNAYTVPSVSITTARTGASAKANVLGMRAMQERAYAKRGEQYLLIKSPPASGKSRALMYIAVARQWNLCNAPGIAEPRVAKSKVDAVRQFLQCADIGGFFILGGQLAYVAEVGEAIKAPNGESDARLRVIYANGTESNLLRRSLQRALYKDDTGRRLTDPYLGPLFGDQPEPDDIEVGTIYVLRSQSSHPFVAEHRELIHKIGVTGGKVETRIAGAEKSATYLLAEVEVVATYKLHNLDRIRLENMFHRLFGAAQLDLTIEDRLGHPIKPREWFLIPLHVIDEAVRRIRDGSIADVVYDPKTARLVRSL